LLVLTVTALGITLFACGGGGDQMESESETPATQAQQQTAQPAKMAQDYPLDYCIVSGEKLGEMGEPVTYNYKGRTIKFCCNHCVETFEKSPEMYIAKIDSAAAGLLKAPESEMHMEGHEGHGHGG
jgi:YHS domain-containing protein